MSRTSDYLRSLGIPEDTITAMTADLDQDKAEADHLLQHALGMHRGDRDNALLESMAIRRHIDDRDELRLRGLLACVLSRAGQLADAVAKLGQQRDDLKAALAAAQEGQL